MAGFNCGRWYIIFPSPDAPNNPATFCPIAARWSGQAFLKAYSSSSSRQPTAAGPFRHGRMAARSPTAAPGGTDAALPRSAPTKNARPMPAMNGTWVAHPALGRLRLGVRPLVCRDRTSSPPPASTCRSPEVSSSSPRRDPHRSGLARGGDLLSACSNIEAWAARPSARCRCTTSWMMPPPPAQPLAYLHELHVGATLTTAQATTDLFQRCLKE